MEDGEEGNGDDPGQMRGAHGSVDPRRELVAVTMTDGSTPSPTDYTIFWTMICASQERAEQPLEADLHSLILQTH